MAPSEDVETTQQVTVRTLDPHDEQAFAAWFAVTEAAERHDRPGEPGLLLHEQRSYSRAGTEPDADTACVLLAAARRRPGRRRRPARAAAARQPAPVRARAVGRARRPGAGASPAPCRPRSARLAHEHGRTTLLGYADEPPGSEGRSGNRAAAQRLGYAVVQQEVRRDIDLPLPAARVEELERACRPHAADYDVRVWREACPEDVADDLAELMRQMSTDVPKDQMDWREEVWDAARLRRDEQRSLAMDRTWIGAGAVHRATGRLVAFTTMGVPRSRPERAYQWETLVSADHRGHRLGTLVKLAGLQELAVHSPRTGVISTWNAQENGPMIAVNDLLGARVNGRLAILQQVLERAS